MIKSVPSILLNMCTDIMFATNSQKELNRV